MVPFPYEGLGQKLIPKKLQESAGQNTFEAESYQRVYYAVHWEVGFVEFLGA
jgi:hypothetical protein